MSKVMVPARGCIHADGCAWRVVTFDCCNKLGASAYRIVNYIETHQHPKKASLLNTGIKVCVIYGFLIDLRLIAGSQSKYNNNYIYYTWTCVTSIIRNLGLLYSIYTVVGDVVKEELIVIKGAQRYKAMSMMY